jgi:hypothetical protein
LKHKTLFQDACFPHKGTCILIYETLLKQSAQFADRTAISQDAYGMNIEVLTIHGLLWANQQGGCKPPLPAISGKEQLPYSKTAAYRCSTFRQIQYRSLTICNNRIKRENEHSKYL